MLSEKSFYSDGRGAYVIGKKTDKTILFTPVKSEFVGYGEISSAFLYDSIHRATNEPDESRQPIRFRIKNNFSSKGLASFYENKKGIIAHMYELDGDTFSVGHNYG